MTVARSPGTATRSRTASRSSVRRRSCSTSPVDRPSAFVAVRLCDVAPDGASTRVTFGVLNLTHRDGHADPRPMVPGARTTVRVRLNDTAYSFRAGHRLRIAISTDYWPMVWPSPQPVTITVHGGSSTLTLPVRPPRAEDATLPDLGEPTWGPPAETTELRPGAWGRDIRTDVLLGETSVTNVVEGALVRLERTGRALALTGFDRVSVRDDPVSARAESRRRVRARPRRRDDPRRRGAWPVVHGERLPAGGPDDRRGGRDGRLDGRLGCHDPARPRLTDRRGEAERVRRPSQRPAVPSSLAARATGRHAPPSRARRRRPTRH